MRWQTLLHQGSLGVCYLLVAPSCLLCKVKLKAVYSTVCVLHLQMSDQMFDAIDNMLKAPLNSLQSSHEQFNTSAR